MNKSHYSYSFIPFGALLPSLPLPSSRSPPVESSAMSGRIFSDTQVRLKDRSAMVLVPHSLDNGLPIGFKSSSRYMWIVLLSGN
jgi:hypothetical protein